MKVHQIMTAHARGVGPDNTLVEAAGLMREFDVGALPVFNGEELAGMITDRDMVLRGIADGRDPTNTTVGHVMSQGVIFVLADQEVEDVARIMQERQVRRVPVLNAEKRLVGIVSIGDIAISSNPAFAGIALRDVSRPSTPSTRQRRLTRTSEPARMPAEHRANGGNLPKEKMAGRPTGKGRSVGANNAARQRAAVEATAKRRTAPRVRLANRGGRRSTGRTR